jgi:hypothetical protein
MWIRLNGSQLTTQTKPVPSSLGGALVLAAASLACHAQAERSGAKGTTPEPPSATVAPPDQGANTVGATSCACRSFPSAPLPGEDSPVTGEIIAMGWQTSTVTNLCAERFASAPRGLNRVVLPLGQRELSALWAAYLSIRARAPNSSAWEDSSGRCTTMNARMVVVMKSRSGATRWFALGKFCTPIAQTEDGVCHAIDVGELHSLLGVLGVQAYVLQGPKYSTLR